MNLILQEYVNLLIGKILFLIQIPPPPFQSLQGIEAVFWDYESCGHISKAIKLKLGV